MYWADKFAQEIIKSKKHKPYWVDDMKTPSGRVHIGSVRAVVTHYLVYRALIDQGLKATFSYVLEDHDPLNKLPSYLDEKKYSKHLGKPLFQVPSPDKGYKSFGHRWGQEYQEIFNSMGVKPKVIWGSSIYLSGKMNKAIKACLDKSDKIRQIYVKFHGKDVKPKDWTPFSPVCSKCGKLMSTKTTAWDGEKVSYICQKDVFDGCGHKDKASPFSSKNHYAGKLPWKIEWACKWQAIGVTVEGAGKDHMTEGGSHDISSEICKQIINYPVPFNFSHEFFLIGGRKMSSSKGVGTSAKEVSEIIPPFLLRFMIVRVKYNRAINFDPGGMTIPDLFDGYDQAANAYWDNSDKKLARIFELSQVSGKPPQKHFLPRFRDIAQFIQHPEIDIYNKFDEIKGKKLTDFEKDVLEDRIKYAKIWLDGYAPKEAIFTPSKEIPEEASNLTPDQKSYLLKVVSLIKTEYKNPLDFQQALYDLAKEMGLSTKDAFSAIYLSLIGKSHGPRAAWFLLEHSKLAQKRFKAISTLKVKTKKTKYRFPTISDTSLVSIKDDIKKAYPSMKIALVAFKGVSNSTYHKGFEKYRDQVVDSLKNTTLDDINQSSKIASYRQAIRESGIDWHSRRPTMEALLRRIAQNKPLFWINPLVDIGNLIAMKHHASQGIFDLDNLKTPTTMQKSIGGEKVLMIGDKKPITLKKGEICYFDQKGPFIVDLCWRDAQRTGATETTKNALFLSEAVYDISREELETTLTDLIKTVTKYCGGKVVEQGIITAS